MLLFFPRAAFLNRFWPLSVSMGEDLFTLIRAPAGASPTGAGLEPTGVGTVGVTNVR